MKQYIIFCLIVGTLFINGCKPEDDDPVGGKGGNAILRVTTRHHSKMIDSCTVYIKYNATSAPVSYDDSAKVIRGTTDTVAVFNGLKPGKYFLFGKGYDPAIAEGVEGGVPFNVTTETTYQVLCPVSEPH